MEETAIFVQPQTTTSPAPNTISPHYRPSYEEILARPLPLRRFATYDGAGDENIRTTSIVLNNTPPDTFLTRSLHNLTTIHLDQLKHKANSRALGLNKGSMDLDRELPPLPSPVPPLPLNVRKISGPSSHKSHTQIQAPTNVPNLFPIPSNTSETTTQYPARRSSLIQACHSVSSTSSDKCNKAERDHHTHSCVSRSSASSGHQVHSIITPTSQSSSIMGNFMPMDVLGPTRPTTADNSVGLAYA